MVKLTPKRWQDLARAMQPEADPAILAQNCLSRPGFELQTLP